MDKIDIRDLRVGNWLSVHHPTMPAENIQISADWIRTIEQINNGLIKEDSPLFRIVEPIPLTKEILEKNGIKCLVLESSGKITYSCNEPPISCTFIPDRGWYLSAGPVGSTKLPFAEISKAYYVHELQHVIRDAKVDKELTI